ncbi:putative ribonuclease H-like domain-containing protein [Tanacetum coccineum]
MGSDTAGYGQVKVKYFTVTNEEILQDIDLMDFFQDSEADYNYHQRERVVSGNNKKVNYNYSAKKAHPSAHRNIVSRAVLMKTSLRPLNIARPINTAHPKTTVYSARPMPNSAVVNAVRANQVNAVRENQGSSTKNEQGYVDSGCTRHKTAISYPQTSKNLMEDMLLLGGAKGGRITGKGTLKTDKLDFEDVYFVEELQFNLFTEKATLDKSMLWHRRLCHVNFKTINKLVKDNLVKGLPIKHFENDQTCVACLKGKQHKASCKSKIQNSITQPLFMLHMDLFGPTFVSSLMNKKYCLVVTDDYSRFTWVFFLASKDETSGILKSFITQIENLVDKKVKIIRCDNGTEFKNRVMSEFCEKKGIKREFSVARTPQQNGVAERRNRTLIEAARTMLADSKLPTTFWAEELFRGRTPSLSFMKPFGCHVTILNTLDHLGKFDGKSDDGFFVGYSLNSKAFRVYNIKTRKVEENLHVRFLEDNHIIAGDGPKWLFDIDVLTKLMNYVPVVAGTNSNDFVGTKESIGAGHSSEETGSSQDYILMPLDAGKKDDNGVSKESGIDDQEKLETNSQDINTAKPSINTEQELISLGNNATLEATHDDYFDDET